MIAGDLRDAFSVADRVAVVTGASSGIGLHLTELLARSGSHVIAASRSAPESPTLRRLSEDDALNITALSLDVASSASVSQFAAEVQARVGHVDILINNAGNARPQSMLETTDEEWSDVLSTNLSGQFMVCRAMVPMMPSGSSIIQIASIGAFKAIKGLSSYAASKAGLVMLSRSIALELSSLGIRVNVIVPGYVVTPMNEDFLSSPQGERIKGKIPLGRFAQPDDLDGAVLFLASRASSYVTGACINVDGGFLL